MAPSATPWAARAGAGLGGEVVGGRAQRRQGGFVERQLDGALAQTRLVGEAHAVGRQHAREGVEQHGVDAELVGHQAGVLPARAPETLQREGGRVVALLDGHLLDGLGHVGDGDAQEIFRHVARVARRPGGGGDLPGQIREAGPHGVGVERGVAARAEDRREMPGLDLAEQDVGVGDGERAAAAVAGRAGVGAGAVGPDAEAQPVEMQQRAAARRHRVDGHHGGAHPHARHLGLEGALEGAGVERHVGRGAAHVEADHAIEAGQRRRAGRPDDAARGAGQDRVLAREGVRLGEAAVRLHEVEPRVPELGGHPIDVAPQHGRQIGVHHGRVGAGDQPQQRADGVAGRHLGEADTLRELGQAPLVVGPFPAVHQGDRHGADAVAARGFQRRAGAVEVERLDFRAVDPHAPADLGDALVQQRRQGDGEVEQAGAGLVADAQRVGEAAVDEQQRALALALQQRVGGDRRAHLDGVDGARRDRLGRPEAQHRPDARHGGVGVAARVLAQQLVGGERAVRRPRHHVREGAAPVDPELPAGRRGVGVGHGSGLVAVGGTVLRRKARGRHRASPVALTKSTKARSGGGTRRRPE